MSENDDRLAALSHEITGLRDSVKHLTKAIALTLRTPPDGSDSIAPSLAGAEAYVYGADTQKLRLVEKVAAPNLSLLLGIERAKTTLLDNARRFANGLSANNALLWGARGMGKSTLIKAVYKQLKTETSPVGLIEIHREDIASLPNLMRMLSTNINRFILFCDDLSFDHPDRDFKALKSMLEGGLDGRPENLLFYATSNRRHMLPRASGENGNNTLDAREDAEEIIALSDRFGLWLGFHPCDQTEYLAMIDAYTKHFDLKAPSKYLALEWAKTRGNRSGRTAWQFVQNLAGEQGKLIRF